MHGFYVDSKKALISFDLVFDFKERDIKKIINEITEKLEEKYPKYRINIVEDQDIA